jgi:WD40 repeat protein
VVADQAARPLCFSPDGAWLAWVQKDQTIHVRDMASASNHDLPGARSAFNTYALDFLSDSRRLTWINEREAGETWDVVSRQRVGEYGGRDGPAAQNLAGAVSRDGAWSARGGRTITLWDVDSGRQLLALPEEQSRVYALAWSPDRRRLAVGTADGGVALWSIPAIRAELARLGLDW